MIVNNATLQPVGNCIVVLREGDVVVVKGDINGTSLHADAVLVRAIRTERSGYQAEVKLWKVHEGHPRFQRGQVIELSADKIFR